MYRVIYRESSDKNNRAVLQDERSKISKSAKFYLSALVKVWSGYLELISLSWHIWRWRPGLYDCCMSGTTYEQIKKR